MSKKCIYKGMDALMDGVMGILFYVDNCEIIIRIKANK